MSRPYPSKDRPQNVDVQSRLEQVESSSTHVGFKPTLQPSNGKKPAPRVATHRCRVFRISSKGLPAGEFIYTAVHDTLEHPTDSELPEGEPVFHFSNVSPTEVERQTNLFRKQEGGVHIIDWRDLGTF